MQGPGHVSTDEPVRQHIHNLLFAYAKTHLTLDHVQWSLNAFSLLQPYFLKEVPLIGQNTFTLPPDPLDVLFSLHNIDQLPRYEERFRTNNEAVQLVKKHLRTREDTPMTKKIIQDNGSTTSAHEQEEWLCPILTRRSSRAGFVQGRLRPLDSVPKSHNVLITSVGLKPVRAEDVEEAEIPYERTLKVLWVMKSDERDAIRDLLRHITDMRRPQANHRNSALHAFLHENDPTSITPPPDEEFAPIFPRSRRMGNISAMAHEQSLQTLIELVPEVDIASEDSNSDIMSAHLEIVDDTLNVSSPMSVATPTTSQEDDKIDQLFLEDSPPTEPVLGSTNEKMEEIEIPRSRRIGGTYGRKAHILHQQTLGTFLPPLVQNAMRKPQKEASPRNSSPVPESLLGQASTDNESAPTNHSNDFDVYIRQLCPNEHPHDIVMKTEVEDARSMFMEALVPQLLPPNIHASDPTFILPKKISDLTEGPDVPYSRRPLKKAVKGLSALRLSLSWVTFTVDAPLPSHQDISDVSELFTTTSAPDHVNRLLQWSLLEDTPAQGARLAILEEDLELPMAVEQDPGPYIAISRRHRKDKVQEPDSGHAAPERERPATEVHRSPRTNDTTEEPEQQWTEPEDVDMFSYEPSVLRFEAPDIEIFYDPTQSDPVCPSSLGKLFHDQTIADDTFLNATNALSFADEINAGNLAVDGTPIDSGLNLTSVDIRGPTAPLEFDSSCSSRLAGFARLRAKTIEGGSTPTPAMDLPPSSSPISEVPGDVIVTLNDPSSLVLPETSNDLKPLHRYMASMDFVQRQAIVRALRTPECNVDLAERTSLGGVDLILDPYSSIIVASSFTLPAYGKQLVDRILEQSWRFTHILVLLEAYPETLAFRPQQKSSSVRRDVSAYTPPILKSIRKLRRDVVIGEACGKKRDGCSIEYAFANDTIEAAKFVRHFGDIAQQRDQTGGLLWKTREWLDLEICPDEGDLSQLEGMNRMSAVILLCQATAEEILDMLPEERLEAFGPLVGFDALDALNGDLEKRFGMLLEHSDISSYSESSSRP